MRHSQIRCFLCEHCAIQPTIGQDRYTNHPYILKHRAQKAIKRNNHYNDPKKLMNNPYHNSVSGWHQHIEEAVKISFMLNGFAWRWLYVWWTWMSDTRHNFREMCSLRQLLKFLRPTRCDFKHESCLWRLLASMPIWYLNRNAQYVVRKTPRI